MAYAVTTNVDEGKSLYEIRRLVEKYGATEFGSAGKDDCEMIMFAIDGLTYRITIPMPRDDQEAADWCAPHFKKIKRAIPSAPLKHERARRMRSMLLIVKAKLVAVEDGVTSLQDEFLQYVVVDNGQTLSERVRPELEAASKAGRIPKALPFGDRNA